MVMPTSLRDALMTLTLLLLGTGMVHAQDRTVTGTVTDVSASVYILPPAIG